MRDLNSATHITPDSTRGLVVGAYAWPLTLTPTDTSFSCRLRMQLDTIYRITQTNSATPKTNVFKMRLQFTPIPIGSKCVLLTNVCFWIVRNICIKFENVRGTPTNIPTATR